MQTICDLFASNSMSGSLYSQWSIQNQVKQHQTCQLTPVANIPVTSILGVNFVCSIENTKNLTCSYWQTNISQIVCIAHQLQIVPVEPQLMRSSNLFLTPAVVTPFLVKDFVSNPKLKIPEVLFSTRSCPKSMLTRWLGLKSRTKYRIPILDSLCL